MLVFPVLPFPSCLQKTELSVISGCICELICFLWLTWVLLFHFLICLNFLVGKLFFVTISVQNDVVFFSGIIFCNLSFTISAKNIVAVVRALCASLLLAFGSMTCGIACHCLPWHLGCFPSLPNH